MRTLLVALLAGSTLTGVASAQTLGAAAKQEEARRKAVKSTGKVYTNDSLKPEPAPAPPPASSATAPASGDKAAAGAADQASKAAEPKKDESYWKQRVAAERDALNRAQLFSESLQSRINALTADFTARDDPFQRSQIGTDRQKALAELDRVRKEIDEHTKAIADIQEEGRKAGVPAGWIR